MHLLQDFTRFAHFSFAHMYRLSTKNQSLHHFLLKVFCANLKPAPFSLNSSRYFESLIIIINLKTNIEITIFKYAGIQEP